MMPRYNDGDIVLVEREPSRSFDSLIGDEAVVMTLSGKRYLKKIMPWSGDRRGHYKLVSVNAPTIETPLRWASPVVVIIPYAGVRKVPRKSGGAGKRKARPAAPEVGD